MMSNYEARNDLKSILASDDLAEAALVQAKAALASPGPDREQHYQDGLKIAQYALLTPPITAGIEEFVANPEAPFSDGPAEYEPDDVAQRVGGLITYHANVHLNNNPRSKELINAFAAIRAQKAAIVDKEYADAIAPFETALATGARASVTSTMRVIAATATALALEDPSLSNTELVYPTRKSHKTILALPLIHLASSAPTGRLLEASTAGYVPPLLQVSPRTGKVEPIKPIQHWEFRPGITVAGNPEEQPNVRIGCPISFAPKDLRTDYYETIVNTVVAKGVWQQIIH